MHETIQTLSFQIKNTKKIILSLSLYLNHHPKDKTALSLNLCYNNKLQRLLDEYQTAAGSAFVFNSFEEKLEKAYLS